LIDLPGATVTRAILSHDVTPSVTDCVRGEIIFNRTL